ncbi:MAG TPA: sulfurtransferase [Xanthomonadales bacterium]
MKDKMLVSAQELHAAQASKSCLVFDCRFVLSDPASGYRDYLDAHIPGALYAHLDDDLSGPVTDSSGRHPLPAAEKFAEFLARSGWRPGTMLVAYDLADGSIAARLWWLMKYFGHDDVALLDGGFRAWQSEGFELQSGVVTTARTTPVSLTARADMAVSTADILDNIGDGGRVLVDVRASERFRGEVEPIDPVAGHIPGSLNFPFQLNLSATGCFKPIADVRERLTTLAGRHRPDEMIYMCGSGVTACHTLFAAELAGLKGSKLYAGSWSEWIRDPSRPVEP